MSHEIIRSQTGEVLYKKRHKSGLEVCVIPKEGFSKTYAIMAAKIGSVDDRVKDGDSVIRLPDGIAHFLEHKLFESEEGNAFDRYAKTGASANAYTAFDKTAYLFSCTDKFEESFEVLLDLVQSPYFTEESVKKEQGIIGQEIRMYDDDPEWQGLFNLLRISYKNNPVRVDIAGTAESIAKITPDLLYKCHRSFYHPENMVLCVVGDVDYERVFELSDKWIKTPSDAPPIPAPDFIEPVGPVSALTEKRLSVSLPILYLGFKDNATVFSGVEYLKRSIMIDILLEMVGGKSSELYGQLYDEGLINATFTVEYMSGRGFGLSMFYGQTAEPQTVANRIASEAERLAKRDAKALFERAKKVVYASKLRTFDSVDAIANSFITGYFGGYSLFDTLSVFADITCEETTDMLSSHLSAGNMAMSLILPR